MKFKLDENFGVRTQRLFESADHAVITVLDEGLQRCRDKQLFNICCNEKRCLVTLDLDFSDITRFPPEESNGIIVIRPPHNFSLAILEMLVRQITEAITQIPVTNQLWVVEISRIRIHQSREDF